jgi:ketosteroid isomerase-like protein
MNHVEVVQAFMNAINAHDLERLSKFMTEDHIFIDSLGNTLNGRDKMIAGWKQYFTFCPDYWVSQEEILEKGKRVAVFGEAGGTIAREGELPIENQWRVTAAWLAKVKNGQVEEWRVYADNKPVYDILGAQR